MILRIWHGWTTPADADDYERLVDGSIVPAILRRGIPGLLDVEIVRRARSDRGEVEFVTIMRFEDWQAVEAFAGPGGTSSVVPEPARRLLSRFDTHSQHYDLVGTHRAAV
ncbi:antibiotic biosynthesis monooxygenase [Egicoccus sp. AB-alg2]|uniref:antibiotic biosynthesis monooxygenase n=1 Tax=Egicoccus sp. AB-alg2 TaxID=3242693 RepID=UPI00359E524E